MSRWPWHPRLAKRARRSRGDRCIASTPEHPGSWSSPRPRRREVNGGPHSASTGSERSILRSRCRPRGTPRSRTVGSQVAVRGFGSWPRRPMTDSRPGPSFGFYGGPTTARGFAPRRGPAGGIRCAPIWLTLALHFGATLATAGPRAATGSSRAHHRAAGRSGVFSFPAG